MFEDGPNIYQKWRFDSPTTLQDPNFPLSSFLLSFSFSFFFGIGSGAFLTRWCIQFPDQEQDDEEK